MSPPVDNPSCKVLAFFGIQACETATNRKALNPSSNQGRHSGRNVELYCPGGASVHTAGILRLKVGICPLILRVLSRDIWEFLGWDVPPLY